MFVRRQVFADDPWRVNWIVCFSRILASVFLQSDSGSTTTYKDNSLAAYVSVMPSVMGTWMFMQKFSDIVRFAVDDDLRLAVIQEIHGATQQLSFELCFATSSPPSLVIPLEALQIISKIYSY